jgi:glycosyltransferase involved in cell wall biosynthesis
VAATDVGDVRWILGPEQEPWVVPRPERETAWPLAETLAALCADAELRRRLGAANRARVEREFSFEGMLAAHMGAWRGALAAGA